jgi:hypothetical protein
MTKVLGGKIVLNKILLQEKRKQIIHKIYKPRNMDSKPFALVTAARHFSISYFKTRCPV